MVQKANITAKVDAVIVERLDELSKRLGMTRSEVIENSLIYGLAEGEKFAKRLETPWLRHLMRAAMAIYGETPKDQAELDRMVTHIEEAKKSITDDSVPQTG